MLHTLKTSWLYLVAAFLFYAAPGLAIWADPTAIGLAFPALLFLNPAMAIVVAVPYAYRHGFRPLFALLVGAVFIPAASLAYHDPLVLPYVLAYAAFSLVGLALGWGVYRIARRVGG